MKIESWQLSNLLKAHFESEIQSALHNLVSRLNAGALCCYLMTQRFLKVIVSSCCCFLCILSVETVSVLVCMRNNLISGCEI